MQDREKEGCWYITILTIGFMFSTRSLVKLSPNFYTFKAPSYRFQGIDFASLCSLAGQYVK
jgi:hypothetical protein